MDCHVEPIGTYFYDNYNKSDKRLRQHIDMHNDEKKKFW